MEIENDDNKPKKHDEHHHPDSHGSATNGNVLDWVHHQLHDDTKAAVKGDRLVVSLRQILGETFLRNAKIVTAHPLRSNLFQRQGSMGPRVHWSKRYVKCP